MGLFYTPYYAIRLLVFSFLFLSSSVSFALLIKVGSTDFPPFYVINSDNSASGIYVDIMERTLQHAKLDYRIDSFPTKRLYRNLGLGETDIFLGIKGSPEYDDNVLYSKMAISQIQMRVYAIGNTPLPLIKEDFNHYRIITMRGYGYHGLVKYFANPNNNIAVTSTSEHRSSFLMLKNKRADYVINYKHPSETALEDLKIRDLKYTSFYDAKVYFIVSKETPYAAEILNKLELAYLELIELGELEYITNDD
ncbi:MAG: transporter substrate-binding domain-containing protein [Oleispira sp.]